MGKPQTDGRESGCRKKRLERLAHGVPGGSDKRGCGPADPRRGGGRMGKPQMDGRESGCRKNASSGWRTECRSARTRGAVARQTPGEGEVGWKSPRWTAGRAAAEKTPRAAGARSAGRLGQEGLPFWDTFWNIIFIEIRKNSVARTALREVADTVRKKRDFEGV